VLFVGRRYGGNLLVKGRNGFVLGRMVVWALLFVWI
jgi:hypothetical protein